MALPHRAWQAAAAIWLLAVAYMVLIWQLSAQSRPWLPPSLLTWDDVALHSVEYAVLGFLLAQAAAFSWPQAPWHWQALGALAVAVAWGGLDELHQRYVPGRSAEWSDWLADALGAGLGIALQLALRRLNMHRLSRAGQRSQA